MFETFYSHNTIKLYTAIFGSLFADLKLERSDEEITIPLMYGTGSKALIYNKARTKLKDKDLRIKSILPRMAFTLESWEYDPTRQFNKKTVLKSPIVDDNVFTQKNPVPYKFNYRLILKTKTLSECLQVVEQILTSFDPYVNVNVEDNPDLSISNNIQIKLVSSGFNDDMGSTEESRSVEVSFDFVLDGYLYKQTSGRNSIIKEIDISFFDDIKMTNELTSEHIHLDENDLWVN